MKKQLLLLIGILFINQSFAQIKLPSQQSETKAPVKQTTTVKTTETKPAVTGPVLTLKVIPNASCKFYVDGELKATITKDAIEKIYLKKGEYQIKAVSSANEADVYKILYTVNAEDLGSEKFYEVDLQTQIKSRIEKMEQQKIAEQMALEQKTNGYSFFDDFTDNKNRWAIKTDENKIIAIEYGKLSMEALTDKYSYHASKFLPLDIKKDFTIEVITKWIKGANDNGYGVDFASVSRLNNYYNFNIASNGYYQIVSMENDGDWNDIVPWTQSSLINQGAIPNILKIEKKGNYISYFVNDNLLTKIPWDGGYGSDFGTRIFGKQTVQFDDFKVSGIADKKELYIQEINNEKNTEVALEKCNKAIREFPNHLFFYSLKGYCLQKANRLEESLAAYKEGCNHETENDKCDYYTIGYLSNDLKNYEQADHYYEKAIKMSPEAAHILNSYSYALAERGEKLDDAARYAEKANKLRPNTNYIEDTYAWVLYKQQKFTDAKYWIEKALEHGGTKSGPELEHYGDILFKLGEHENAYNNWVKAKQTGGELSEFIDRKIADKNLYE